MSLDLLLRALPAFILAFRKSKISAGPVQTRQSEFPVVFCVLSLSFGCVWVSFTSPCELVEALYPVNLEGALCQVGKWQQKQRSSLSIRDSCSKQGTLAEECECRLREWTTGCQDIFYVQRSRAASVLSLSRLHVHSHFVESGCPL